MTRSVTPVDQVLDQLQAAYPGWRLWRTRNPDGSPAAWYATRARPLTDRELRAGLAATVADDTPELLVARLAGQEEIADEYVRRRARP
ncbi:MAG: hypothetical protein L0Y54_11410 [Sporichthyaceae bacterium]|nr:hypothetical protein [Sporichthyaceae bacterium]